MDKAIISGLLIVFVVGAAIAGLMLFNTKTVNNNLMNTVIQNTGNNSSNNDSVGIPSSNAILNIISFSSGGYSQVIGSNPSPVTDPMTNIINLFDAYVKSTFSQSGIPGAAVVIVKDGEIIYMNCLGLRNVASGEPVTTSTLFQIASCTKAFTATNVAQSVDHGLLGWDDKINKYYNDTNKFLLYDNVTGEVTIRDVLIQRVGLPANSGDEFGLFNYTSYDEGLYKLRFITNSSPFRSTFTYNNILYSMAGECAAQVNNTNWSDLIKKELLEPLGMNTATTTYEDFLNYPDRIHTYIHIDNVLTERVPLEPVNKPAGIIASSITEIANWLKFQIADTGMYNGVQIVSKAGLDETRRGQIYQNNNTMYGLGWNIRPTMIDHSGSEYYSNAVVSILPTHKIGVAVFSNEGTYGLAFDNSLLMKFLYLLGGDTSSDPWPQLKQQLMPQPPLPPVNGTPIPPKALNTYIGVYSNPLFGNITITDINSTLYCNYGNDMQSFNLTHWSGDVFIEKNFNQPFNFTEISGGQAHELTTNIKDYTTTSQPPAVFNRTNST